MSTPTDTDQPSCKLDPEFSDFVLEHVHNEHGNFNQEAMRSKRPPAGKRTKRAVVSARFSWYA